MPEKRSPAEEDEPSAERILHSESADPFHALLRAGARDGEVRCYVAALLDAQDMPEERRDEIWRAFLAAGDAHPRVPGTADE